jgi:galactose mutarotase-like enzyme
MSHAVDTGVQEGFEVLVLRSPSLEAVYAPGAGMVCCSLLHRGEELLGRRDGLAAYAERGKTMGIPLLHPWANRLAGLEYEALGRRVRLDPAAMPVKLEEHGLPIHGLLAGDPRWHVLDHAADDGGARVAAELDFTHDPALLAGFPFPHRLRVDAVLRGAELTVVTALAAESATAVPVAFGYHPYFVLPGVPRGDWRVELPDMRHMELDDSGLPTGSATPEPARAGALGEQTYDDAYALEERPARFALAGGGRRIAVDFLEGYPYAQVFAPGVLDVVCFEPMAAPVNALATGDHPVAAPGETFLATFRVSVEG